MDCQYGSSRFHWWTFAAPTSLTRRSLGDVIDFYPCALNLGTVPVAPSSPPEMPPRKCGKSLRAGPECNRPRPGRLASPADHSPLLAAGRRPVSWVPHDTPPP